MSDERINGRPVSDQQIEAWADEAEAGYPVEQLRRRGRPTIGDGPGVVVPVRMDASLIDQLTQTAERLHVSRSEVVRRAVRAAVDPG